MRGCGNEGSENKGKRKVHIQGIGWICGVQGGNGNGEKLIKQ